MDLSSFIDIDFISALIAIIILLVIVLKNKEKLSIYKILFPIIYMVIYRTKYGLSFMDKIAEKYRAVIRFIGFCFIGFGFYFMLFATYMIIRQIIAFFIAPTQVDTEMALLLPGTNLPGIGIISFWHWIICIFLLAIVHEGAHGIMARAYDVKIKSSGFALFSILLPILPAAFVEPDEHHLKRQPDYIQYSIYAAGPMVNITLALLLLFALPWVNPFASGENSLAPYEDVLSEPDGFSAAPIQNYPAYNSSMPKNAMIKLLNDEKVKDYVDFAKKMQSIKPNTKINLGISNGTSIVTYSITTITHPQSPDKAYIGILGLKNERMIKQDHKTTGSIYYWFKGLFMWFYLLNLALGITNLLPLGIVDGGRMLQVLFKSVFTNKKKAQKFWLSISFALLAFLIIGMVAHYLKSWGLF